jgi:hypothetical protein
LCGQSTHQRLQKQDGNVVEMSLMFLWFDFMTLSSAFIIS